MFFLHKLFIPFAGLGPIIEHLSWEENNMINAYMFMDVEPGCSQKTLTRMKRLSQIESVSVVSGSHDLIARVSVDDLERLHDITEEVHRITGVMKTNTHVISKEINVGK